MDARLQAIDKLEALVDEVVREKARHRSNVALKRAVRTWRKGDIVKAGQWALKATEADPDNSKAFHVLAMALERMGHLHKALVTYERAFELDPEDPELLINLGLTAWNLKLTDGAAKMFQLYIAACPDSPLGYNNLGSVQSDMGEPDVAIETLRAALFRMPDQAILWNSLATVLAENSRADESLIFYEEAARLEPRFRPRLSQSGLCLSAPQPARQGAGRPMTRRWSWWSIRRSASRPRHSRSICLIGLGKMEEGFREYEIRNNERFRCYFHHMIDAPRWQGEDVRGKKLLLVGEQGLGDEIMFANILPDAQAAVGETGKLQICVDPRMIPLYQRSFPKAEVGTYDDRTLIDDGRQQGAAPGALRLQGTTSPTAGRRWAAPCNITANPSPTFPQQGVPGARSGAGRGIQAPDGGPARQEGRHLLALHDAGGQARPNISRPSTPGARCCRHRASPSSICNMATAPPNMARAKEKFGVTIHQVEGLDLKDDIDGTAALCQALDLVLSAPTAAAHTAASVGAQVWFLSVGLGWPQMGTAEYPWYPNTRVFWPAKLGDWADVMPRYAAALAAFAAS